MFCFYGLLRQHELLPTNNPASQVRKYHQVPVFGGPRCPIRMRFAKRRISNSDFRMELKCNLPHGIKRLTEGCADLNFVGIRTFVLGFSTGHSCCTCNKRLLVIGLSAACKELVYLLLLCLAIGTRNNLPAWIASTHCNSGVRLPILRGSSPPTP